MAFSKLPVCLLFAALFALATAKKAKQEEPMKVKPQVIYPGTHYCGQGSDGRDGGALFSKIDACCKEHDACPISLKPGATDYGVTNKCLFTISGCDCDTAFRACLKAAGGFNAGVVATIFNSSAGLKCLKKDEPPTCIKYTNGTCEAYKTYSIVLARF